MEIYPLFYKTVPRRAQFALISFLTFVVLCGNGIYIGNITDMYSSMGEYNEPYIMGFNAVYIGLGLGLIFIGKLNLHLTNKFLVLAGLGSMLLLHLLIATTTNPQAIVAACLILGFTKVMALGPIYLDLIASITKTFDTPKVYPYLYFLALGGLYFTTWVMNVITFEYNWQASYLVQYLAIAMAMVLVAFFVERHPLKNRIPLHQSDIPGMLFFTLFLMLVNYIVVYGKVENWLESPKIMMASFAAPLSLLLFIRRELLVKRPFLPLWLFAKNNFAAGLFYFFILGVFLPVTFQTSFSSGVLHFESIRNSEINLYLLPGIILGCIVSYFWYLKKLEGQLLIIVGFGTFVLYHVMMYRSFTNEFALEDFWFPSIVKGFAMALLYISIGLFTTARFPLAEVLKVSGTMVIVRSFLGTGTFSGIYNYLLAKGRLQHLDYLATSTDADDALVRQNTAGADFLRNISNQATLAASKQISGSIIIFGILLIAVLVLLYYYRKLKHRILEIR
jgi:hypothetical protein